MAARIDPRLIDEIEAHYLDGHEVYALSVAYGLHERTIYRHLRNRGTKLRYHGETWLPRAGEVELPTPTTSASISPPSQNDAQRLIRFACLVLLGHAEAIDGAECNQLKELAEGIVGQRFKTI